MSNAFKEAFKLYKQIKWREKQKKRLVSKNLDYAYLEYMINEVEEHNVELDITTADHAHIIVKPIKKDEHKPQFIGD